MKISLCTSLLVLICLTGCSQVNHQNSNPPIRTAAPLKNFFGVNAFEWDFEDPANAMQLDSTRLVAISSFTGVRHYMDWEKLEPTEGHYTYSPVHNGGWNYDTIYQWCRARHIDVLPCLKALPPWMEDTYPKDQQDNENIPMRYGKDPSDPASYIEQARMGFQYAARYGDNKKVDHGLLHVDTLPRWTNDPVNQIRVGLGTIHYIECDNERDKWWKGAKAYQTGRQYAANLSAFYDGNKNKMGPGAGVKNADPSMKVVMAGLANPSTDYVKGMIDWSKEHRGLKPDGSVDLPWDVINYHYYSNNAVDYTGKDQSTGVAPEMSKAADIAIEFIRFAHQYAGDMPVWITETGYDLNQQSPQKAIAIGNKTVEETQADWILRTGLLYSRLGIQKVFFYELNDDNAENGAKFATSGLINKNRTRRPAASFLYQTNKLFGEYTYVTTINTNPIVDSYTYHGQAMYMLVSPTQTAKTTTYSLNLGNVGTAFIYHPTPRSDNMAAEKRATRNGKIEITVSETPVFITAFEATKNSTGK